MEDENYYSDENLEVIQLLGPVRDPLSTTIPMTLLYVVLLLTGTIGNVCTCIVIARNRYMHTATNYYLFSLAVSDLLLLILGLPQDLFQLWQRYPYIFGEFFCIVRGLSSETSTNASILTITAFTVERYVAICHPLKSHTMSQLPRAIKTILVIWAVSAICALPVVWQFGIIFTIKKASLRNISRQCGIKNDYFQYGFELTAIVFFLMPITLITILYVLIGINLRRSSQQIKNDPTKLTNKITKKELTTHLNSTAGSHEPDYINLYQRNNSVSSSNQKQIASRRSVIRMLVAVVIAFFICYSPFHAQRVLATTMQRYNLQSPSLLLIFTLFTHISGITYYLSATINPILYQLMSRKFRIAFKDTFGQWCPCFRTELPEITYLNIIGGVTGPQLSRVPSYNSNCSYRRVSYGNEQPSAAIKMVHSFDSFAPYKPNQQPLQQPADLAELKDKKMNTSTSFDINQRFVQDGTTNTANTTETAKLKQFLDVPSVKY